MTWADILKIAVPSAAAVGGAVIASHGATSAAATQAQSADQSLALQKQIFDQQQSNLAPYLNAGQLSLSQLLKGMGINSATAPVLSGNAGNGGGASSYSSPLLGNLKAPASGSSVASTVGSIAGDAGIGATVGSFVPGIGTAIGAGVGAAAGGLTSLIGQGRKQADQLVPIQNQVAGEVDRINQAVIAAKNNGTLTQQDLQTAINTVQGLQSQFGQVAQGFDKAGAGGVATLAKYFDPLVQTWQGQLQGLPATAPASGSPAAAGTDGTPAAAATGTQPSDATQNPGGVTFGQFTQPFDYTKDPTYNAGFAAENHPFTQADFTADPGYAFRLSEGEKALERSGAARGGVLGGANLKAITRYGQDYASNEFGNAYNRFANERGYGNAQYTDAYNRFNNDQTNQFNRLSLIAGLGQTANSQSNASSANFGNSAADLITGAGNATAAGQVASSAAIGGALNTGANLYSQDQTLRQILAANAANQGKSGYQTFSY